MREVCHFGKYMKVRLDCFVRKMRCHACNVVIRDYVNSVAILSRC